MTIRKLLVLALLPVVAAVAATDNNLEFSGVLVLPNKTTVHLGDKASGTSAWMAIGESFDGYVISAYDAKTESVVLTKNGATLRIRLNTAKVQEGKAAPPADPAVIEQQRRAILNNMRQIAAAADQYYLEHGTNHTTLAELVGPTKYIKALNPVAGEDYSQLELSQGKALSITAPNGIKIDYAP